MKIRVDSETCQLHGQCVIAAPEVFSFNDEGELAWIHSPSEEQLLAAQAAAGSCPEQAISLEP